MYDSGETTSAGRRTASRFCRVSAVVVTVAFAFTRSLAAQVSSPPAGYRPLPTTVPTTHPLGSSVRVRLREGTLNAALDALSEAGKIRITYGDAVLASRQRITVDGRATPILTILRQILRAGDLAAFTSDDGRAVLIVPAGDLFGRVVDAETGVGIRGAQVSVRAFAVTVRSEEDGRYRLISLPLGIHRLEIVVDGAEPHVDTVHVERDRRRPHDLAIRRSGRPLTAVVINARALGARPASALAPSIDLAGRDLDRALADNIASTIAGQAGVWQRYNGPAAAQPVVRGLSGNRVLVLEDGQQTGDIAATAADHAITIDPTAARAVELVRGPTGVVFGSNLLGGVINVVREDVPRSRPERMSAVVSSQFQSNAPGGVAGISTVAPVGRMVVRMDATARGATDTRTPLGVLPSTDLRTGHLSAAASVVDSSGYLGGLVREYRSRYGVPSTFNGRSIPGAHVDGVYIDLHRTSFRAEGERVRRSGPVGVIRAELNHVRFVQSEIERGGVVGTQFGQLTSTATLLAHGRSTAPTARTVGITATRRDFAAAGSFTGSRPALQHGLATFFSDAATRGRVQLQWGVRADWTHVNPTDTSPSRLLPQVRRRTFTDVSGALAASAHLTEGMTAGAQLTRAFRAPAVEELYSNGPHLANYAYEIGNPASTAEIGHGIEAFAQLIRPRFTADLATYANAFRGFLYYRATGELDARFRRYPVYRASQTAALLRGAEARLRARLRPRWSLHGQVSAVDGRTDAGQPLPAMPPLQWTAETEFTGRGWSAALGGEGAGAQQRVDVVELPTGAYALVTARVVLERQRGVVLHRMVFSVRNLSDVSWRDHLSRVRAVAPQPGRNLQVSYRAYF
jgi:iron complex outermembrane receptor protein